MSAESMDLAAVPADCEFAGAVRSIAAAVDAALAGADRATIAAALAAAGAAAEASGPDDYLPPPSAAALLAAVARHLDDGVRTRDPIPPAVEWAGAGRCAGAGCYNGLRRWPDGKYGDVIASAARTWSFMAEGIGAGMVHAVYGQATWPAGNQAHYDVIGGTKRVDVKSAWYHRDGVLGVPPAPAKGFDPAKVQEICPVELEYVRGRHGYLPDGTMWTTIWARPSAVFLVPVEMYAKMIKPDGKSCARSLVKVRSLERYRVR